MAHLRKWAFSMLFLAVPAVARPVSFADSLSVMWFAEGDTFDAEVNYSPSHRYSLGLAYARTSMYGPEQNYPLARFNWLAHRINAPDYQANLFLSLYGGAAESGGSWRAAGGFGVEADAESRRVYGAIRASVIAARGLKPDALYEARFGVAPYLADFEGFHSWVILQAQYWPGALREDVRVGPVMRFFINNVLWEIGVTVQGSWLFNAMISF